MHIQVKKGVWWVQPLKTHLFKFCKVYIKMTLNVRINVLAHILSLCIP